MLHLNKETAPLYGRWTSMHKRCRYGLGNYGNLGITVCPEWSGPDGFNNFASWAFENGYAPDLVIDRIDTFGNYSPENCRWVTTKENNRNRTTTVFISSMGKQVPLSQYCEERGYGIREYNRLYRNIKRSMKSSFL